MNGRELRPRLSIVVLNWILPRLIWVRMDDKRTVIGRDGLHTRIDIILFYLHSTPIPCEFHQLRWVGVSREEIDDISGDILLRLIKDLIPIRSYRIQIEYLLYDIIWATPGRG